MSVRSLSPAGAEPGARQCEFHSPSMSPAYLYLNNFPLLLVLTSSLEINIFNLYDYLLLLRPLL